VISTIGGGPTNTIVPRWRCLASKRTKEIIGKKKTKGRKTSEPLAILDEQSRGGERNPGTLAILDFIYRMQRYRVKEPIEPVLITACQAELERGWCATIEFEFDKAMRKIIEWMMHRKDWILTKVKLESEEKLSDDLEKHLKYFGMIAKYTYMRAESDRTKKLLMESLQETLRNTEDRDKHHRYKKYDEIIQLTTENKDMFNKAVGL